MPKEGDKEVETPTPPPTETTHLVSSVKIPILKKGEYTVWAIRIEEYLAHTGYSLWEVILNGNAPPQFTQDKDGKFIPMVPTDAKTLLQRTKERKARSALLMAVPDSDLPKYHALQDAKKIWEAIAKRYGGNEESKKM